jgi:hypothetical protein
MAEPLHSKYKALGSDLSTTKKKKGKKERRKRGGEGKKEGEVRNGCRFSWSFGVYLSPKPNSTNLSKGSSLKCEPAISTGESGALCSEQADHSDTLALGTTTNQKTLTTSILLRITQVSLQTYLIPDLQIP